MSEKSVVTEGMTAICYKTAKEIYPDETRIKLNAEKIAKGTGVNQGLANDYLKDFFFMVKGEKLSRCLNEEALKYYLENIKIDFGKEILKNAVKPMELYLVYDKQDHPGIQIILNEIIKQENLI